MPDDVNDIAGPSRSVRCIKILLLITVVFLLNSGGGWLAHQINFQLYPRHEPYLHLVILGSFGLYILLMTLPFMPGIEIGLTLMLFLGSKGVILVYCCTLIALSISFLIGQRIPLQKFANFLGWLHLKKVRDLILEMEPLPPGERIAILHKKAPARIVPHLLKHRYLTIALLLNLPCNAVIGGGGGIGMIVGMSGLITYTRYLLTIAVSISPVPIAIFLKGSN
ncbi:MAG: hypothetical protein P8Y96_09070 [Desulfuromonadales bacterium]|jgi:hypothetical protein